MNPADPRDFKPSALGHYPLHWVSHIMHGLEVVGYCHSDEDTAEIARGAYFRMAHSLHLVPETKDEMLARLTEDRIAANTVVS